MSLFNEDELVPPSWIDKEFFGTVLEDYEKAKVKVNKLHVMAATIKGDHYTCLMFRCKVDYKIESSSESKQSYFVLKTLPNEGFRAELMPGINFFENEINMYRETLPIIDSMLAEGGESTKLAAKIIYHSTTPHKVIIFEDLCAEGYRVLRGRYLKEEELLMVYQKVAKMHAATFFLGRSEYSQFVTKYNEAIFNNVSIESMDSAGIGIHKFVNTLSQYEEFSQYLEKIKILEPEMIVMCKYLFSAHESNRDPKDIFVLNHGDLHMKNLMFKFNEEDKLEDCVMVDYQICCYAPSCVDWTFSQYLLLRPELRLRRNEFMHYYFSEFIRILRRFGFRGELPRYSEFHMANLKYRQYGLFLLSTFLPIVNFLNSVTKEELLKININNFLDDENAVTMMYNHAGYLEDLCKLLPSLLIDGYLD